MNQYWELSGAGSPNGSMEQIGLHSWNVYKLYRNESLQPAYRNYDLEIKGDDLTNDVLPRLPVCLNMAGAHEYGENIAHFPCLCGDKFGSESHAFWEWSGINANWRADSSRARGVQVRHCRQEISGYTPSPGPAIVALNMCRVRIYSHTCQHKDEALILYRSSLLS